MKRCRYVHGRRLLRQSRARAAGARSCAGAARQGTLRRRGGDHQQPHGTDWRRSRRSTALKRPCAVDLHTDSEYVKDGITGGSTAGRGTAGRPPTRSRSRTPSSGRRSTRPQPHKVTWHWVKGHAGHAENERADELARAGHGAVQAGQGPRRRHTNAGRLEQLQEKWKPVLRAELRKNKDLERSTGAIRKSYPLWTQRPRRAVQGRGFRCTRSVKAARAALAAPNSIAWPGAFSMLSEVTLPSSTIIEKRFERSPMPPRGRSHVEPERLGETAIAVGEKVRILPSAAGEAGPGAHHVMVVDRHHGDRVDAARRMASRFSR